VPGSGSSFVVVLPGTTELGQDSIEAVLERALADEELLLEEAAVLRAIRSAGRPVALETPARFRGARDRPLEPALPPVRLHAIDGALSRTDQAGPHAPPDPA
jgi:hypothetical protein